MQSASAMHVVGMSQAGQMYCIRCGHSLFWWLVSFTLHVE